MGDTKSEEGGHDEFPPGECLASALVRVQEELTNPSFDSTNPHFKSKYVSLAKLRDHVTPVLTRNLISATQRLGFEVYGSQFYATCTTILMHASGQKMEYGPAAAPVDKNNPQAACSAYTYLRRYSLQAAVGLVGDEDDDGNAASLPPAAPPKPVVTAADSLTQPIVAAPVVDSELLSLAKKAKAAGMTPGIFTALLKACGGDLSKKDDQNAPFGLVPGGPMALHLAAELQKIIDLAKLQSIIDQKK